MNLYGFVGNNGIYNIDVLGLNVVKHIIKISDFKKYIYNPDTKEVINSYGYLKEGQFGNVEITINYDCEDIKVVDFRLTGVTKVESHGIRSLGALTYVTLVKEPNAFIAYKIKGGSGDKVEWTYAVDAMLTYELIEQLSFVPGKLLPGMIVSKIHISTTLLVRRSGATKVIHCPGANVPYDKCYDNTEATPESQTYEEY